MKTPRSRSKVASLLASVVALSASPLLTAAPAAALPLATDVEYEVLVPETQDPLGIDVTADGRVLWTEREGELNVRTPDGTIINAAKLPVSANSCDDCVVEDAPMGLEEGGLYAVLVKRDFATSNRIYLYRSMPFSYNEVTKQGKWRLSTFVLGKNSKLDLTSEKVILEVPAEWEHCCHYGGDLSYLPDGTILLSVGDDIPASSSSGYGPRDTSETWLDGEINVQNPADRRGKILRLMEDGSVPNGTQPGIKKNPFVGKSGYNPYIKLNPNVAQRAAKPYVSDRTGSVADHTIAYDPYIYAIGFKQPFHGAVDPKTGTSYYGDVGPDAYVDDPRRGPRGYDERDVIPFGGGTNYGWPRCMANNKAYHDVDWANGATDLGVLDCSTMTGAAFYYPHDVSAEFPSVGVGTVTGIPAVVYPETARGALRLPARFDNMLIDLEFGRDWIATIPVNDDGSLDVGAFERHAPFLDPAGGIVQPLGPINAAIGPDGALYVIEYGKAFYNGTGSLARLKCAGCQPDPADYITPGSPRPRPTTPPAPPPAARPTTRPGSNLPATGGLPGGVVVGAVLAGLAGVAWRRRRYVA